MGIVANKIIIGSEVQRNMTAELPVEKRVQTKSFADIKKQLAREIEQPITTREKPKRNNKTSAYMQDLMDK